MFQQQDTSEIISCVFDESCGESFHAQEMSTTILKSQVAIDALNESCMECKVNVKLSLQVTNNVQTTLNIFFSVKN